MFMVRERCHAIALLALAALTLAPAAASAAASDVEYRETVVAGGPERFMEVWHVFMRGTNFAIGAKLGEIAAALGTRPAPRGDALLNRIQREYMARNYPILHERMRGIASAFGLSVDDDRFDFSSIILFPTGPPGCSAVFYPGTHTASGHGILSRNFDFTTGTITGRRPAGDETPVMSRPFIFELYPERGYASLAVCAFDLVGGVLDGINEKGLVVAIFGDDDTVMRHGVHPSNGIGFHELMSMRYLLDTCGSVAEAKEALLLAKHIYVFVPCHYLIADRSGESFLFEFSPYRHDTYIIDGNGPRCVTNHLVSLYPNIEEFPDSVMIDTFDRYRVLHDAVTAKSRFTLDEITAINAAVATTGMAFDSPDRAPGRTLWHALYDTEDLSLRVKFYLGDRPDPEGGGGKIAEYSDYVELALQPR
jgi:predicted choloylglycine hydrolase